MVTENNKLIAKNTLFLYFRMLITVVVSLYTSRIVLNTLGVVDFGIYNVVGGVVTMLGFLNGALTTSTQRFLSFDLGNKDFVQLNKTFSNAINIHFLLSIVVLLLAETIGLWIVNNKLTIPIERMNAANWVYQFSVFAFVINIWTVPYNAAIIAHERMSVFAYISLFEVFMKLVVVFTITYFSFDKLKLYSVLIFTVGIFLFLIYNWYCRKKLQACRYKYNWDKEQFVKMFSFTGWNLWGSIAGVGADQGINLLLNVFYGPIVNAARGIAFQVNSVVSQFVFNFQFALNPQIVKYYAEDNKKEMFNLIYIGSRVSFLLFYLIAIPILFNTEHIMLLWLKQVPKHSVLFTQLIIINAIINSISGTIMTTAQATGKIKKYQIIVGTLLFMNLPLSYLILKIYSIPELTIVISILITTVLLFVRLILVRSLAGISIKVFFKNVLTKIFLVVILSALLLFGFNFINFDVKLLHEFILKILTEILITFLIIVSVGLTVNERNLLIKKLLSFIK
jgi:O-antigen/teichoic acid export membrane protein